MAIECANDLPLLPTVLIEQLYKDKFISAEEASRLASTKLFTAPPPTTSTIYPIAYSHAMGNDYSVKASNTNDSSATVMQNTATTICNVGTLTNGMLTETSSASINVMRTTSIHNSDAVTSSKLDQHGELQHTYSTGVSLQPAIVEAPDTDEYSNSNISVISTDENITQHIKQPLQSTDTADMTVDDVTEDVSENLAEDTSQLRNSESDSEHGVMPDTQPLAHNQQNDIVEGNIISCIHHNINMWLCCVLSSTHSS